MSFIVDAARRRQLDEEPSQAATWAYSQMRNRQRRLWMAVGLLTLIAVALTGTLLLRWVSARETSAVATSVDSGSPVPQEVVSSVPAPAVAEAVTPAETVADVPYYQPIESDAPDEEIFRTPVPLDAAPKAIAQELLRFQYSSHLYSTESDGRSMSVNGKRVREGDAIDHWSVDEITESGAIWDNGEILVEVNVLDLWN